MRKVILNIDDAKTFESGHGEVFHATHGLLAKELGAEKIGTSVARVKPGKTAFQFHHHYGSEEHFFIVSGHGTLRHGDQTHPVKPGDYIVHTPGGPETAHQLVNTGSEDLVYLAIGAMVAPEVCGYPDSDKLGVMTSDFGKDGLRFMVTTEGLDRLGYFDGDDGGRVKTVLAGRR